jgi:hypothetical protein
MLWARVFAELVTDTVRHLANVENPIEAAFRTDMGRLHLAHDIALHLSALKSRLIQF